MIRSWRRPQSHPVHRPQHQASASKCWLRRFVYEVGCARAHRRGKRQPRTSPHPPSRPQLASRACRSLACTRACHVSSDGGSAAAALLHAPRRLCLCDERCGSRYDTCACTDHRRRSQTGCSSPRRRADSGRATLFAHRAAASGSEKKQGFAFEARRAGRAGRQDNGSDVSRATQGLFARRCARMGGCGLGYRLRPEKNAPTVFWREQYCHANIVTAALSLYCGVSKTMYLHPTPSADRCIRRPGTRRCRRQSRLAPPCSAVPSRKVRWQRPSAPRWTP